MGVCMYGFCVVRVCVCAGLVMHGCVHVWVLCCMGVCMCGFCNVCVCVYICLGFVLCGCVCEGFVFYGCVYVRVL